MKEFTHFYFYSEDDFENPASLSEGEYLDYGSVYENTRHKYLSQLSLYKKEKEFDKEEVLKLRELIKKYSDESVHKNDFFTALDEFKKEVDALKTKAQKTKEKNRSFGNLIKRGILKLLYIIFWPFIMIVKGIGWVFSSIVEAFVDAFEDDSIGEKTPLGVIFSLLPLAVAIAGWIIVIVNAKQITTFMIIGWAYAGLVVYSLVAIGFTIYYFSDESDGMMIFMLIGGAAFGLLLGLTAGFNLKPNFDISDKFKMTIIDKDQSTVKFKIENRTARMISSFEDEMKIYNGSTYINTFSGSLDFDYGLSAGKSTTMKVTFTEKGYDSLKIAECSYSNLIIEFKLLSITYGDMAIAAEEYSSHFVRLSKY